jgi:hypothetical protein
MKFNVCVAVSFSLTKLATEVASHLMQMGAPPQNFAMPTFLAVTAS